MESVTIGWIDGDESKSESHVPTLWIGQRNKRLGSKNCLNLVIIGGYDKLSQGYKQSLEETGYNIINGENQFHELSKKYSKLNRFGLYEKRCFLRWPLIHHIFGCSSIIHYDGDVVFNETPERLGYALGRYNVVVQGCPAVVSIKDVDWLTSYERELDRFVEDIEGYSAASWRECDEGFQSNLTKWSGIRSRRIITSDQDLIRYLIQADRIPQDDPEAILRANEDLLFFENPLFFFHHNMRYAPFVYERKNGVDFMNNKKVAFWHMQNNFTDYLKLVYISRILLRMPFRVDNQLVRSDNGPICNTYNDVLSRRLFNLDRRQKYTRKDMCKAYFDRPNLSHVFDERTFWCTPKDQAESTATMNRFLKCN